MSVKLVCHKNLIKNFIDLGWFEANNFYKITSSWGSSTPPENRLELLNIIRYVD